MDILHLIDRLEELFNESRAIPLTHQVVVDEDKMLDLIDQMRVSIPEEVKQAQQILSQKDRIMAQAQEEANRTISIAREKGDQLVEQNAIVQAARTRANEIIARADSEVNDARAEADRYIHESLSRLYLELDRIMNQVGNGIRMIERDFSPDSGAPKLTDFESGDPPEPKEMLTSAKN